MPRQSRIDFPGALQHIMVRGIERRYIFKTVSDKRFLLDRCGEILTATETNCFAFAIMSNHFHLLLQTGSTSISRLMQSLLTGYAVNYNLKKRGRKGKLYQNRFKSVLCDKEDYLLQLIRYIHLTPMKVGLIKNMSELARSPWTGHSVLMGNKKAEWLDKDEVLSNFAQTEGKARLSYQEYVQEGIGEEEDLSGGGLIRSRGGEWELMKRSHKGKQTQKETADERILGGGEFVEAVLAHEEELEKRASKLKRKGWDFEKVLFRVSQAMGIEVEELFIRGRSDKRSRGRALLCKWMVDDLGTGHTEVGRKLGLTHQAVSVLATRGRILEQETGIHL